MTLSPQSPFPIKADYGIYFPATGNWHRHRLTSAFPPHCKNDRTYHRVRERAVWLIFMLMMRKRAAWWLEGNAQWWCPVASVFVFLHSCRLRESTVWVLEQVCDWAWWATPAKECDEGDLQSHKEALCGRGRVDQASAGQLQATDRTMAPIEHFWSHMVFPRKILRHQGGAMPHVSRK